MSKKIAYRVRNWKDYNRSLINRGNLTIWFSEDAVNNWYQKPQKNKKRGRCFIYSDTYIELALTIRTLFHLTLRATQGFLEGLVVLLGLNLKISHYSRFSRRAGSLDIQLNTLKNTGEKPTDLVIDSTGLKIFGEGEWKMRTHGKQKRRTWRKYHVSVNPATHEVTAIELTEANIHDCTVMPSLLLKQKNIGKVYADGAYSFKEGFDAISKSGGTPSIPVRSGTTIVRKNPSPGQELRNELLQEIREAGGRIAWKKSSDHHRRSLVETHMFRLKAILGGTLRGRSFVNQKAEAKIMANILNKMAHLGMPKSEKLNV
jgi:IS5 family transposase